MSHDALPLECDSQESSAEIEGLATIVEVFENRPMSQVSRMLHYLNDRYGGMRPKGDPRPDLPPSDRRAPL